MRTHWGVATCWCRIVGEGFSLKRFLPRGLFGRSLIIIVAPIVLLQAIIAYVFFERDLDTTTRRLARDVAADTAMLVALERSIDVQVTRLRRKIEEDPKLPLYLQTVRGVGYMLVPDRG